MDESLRIQKVEKIAHALSLCFNHYFRDVSSEEQGIKLNVAENSREVDDEGKGYASEYLLTSADGVTPLEVRTYVAGGEGNVYDIILRVDGKEQNFAVSVPDVVLDSGDFTPARKQAYFSELCHGLLAEVERAVGTRTLRQATDEAQE